MSDEAQPNNAELMGAILALHSLTDAGWQRLDEKIDRLGQRLHAKVDGVEIGLLDQMHRRFDRVDRRFDRVDLRLDALEGRVARLELHQA